MKTTSKMTQALFLGVIFLFISAFVGNVFVSDAKAQSCIQPPEGMVSWWPGDGSGEDIVGGNDGTLLNGTTFALGKVDEALSFDGVDDFVWATGTGIDDLQELTIDTWVKLNSMDRDEERFVTLTGEKAVLRHDGENSLGQLHFYMNFGEQWPDDDLHHIRVNDVLGVGVWYHVAGTYDGEVMRLYLNGAEVDNLPVTGTVYAGSGVEVSSQAEPINGLLDEVEIFNRALSSDEIWAIYNAGSAGKCKATVALIKAVETINELDPKDFKNKNLGNALTNKINAALAMIDEGFYADAMHKLQHDILQKTNGCADTGKPDKNDWITTCEGQGQVYPIILQTIELLEKLI